MACFSTSYKDVNIESQFLPIELKINGRTFPVLDSYGRLFVGNYYYDA